MYPREKAGFRVGIFLSGSAAANAYGGVLAYGISQARGAIAPWRTLFIVEGIPTCLLAIVTLWFTATCLAIIGDTAGNKQIQVRVVVS